MLNGNGPETEDPMQKFLPELTDMFYLFLCHIFEKQSFISNIDFLSHPYACNFARKGSRRDPKYGSSISLHI